MPIASSDILFKLSTKSGAAGDSTAAVIADSLGKYVSTTAVSTTAQNNLFENVTGDENAASTIFYKCVFVHNNHASLTLQNVVLWLASETAGGASMALGADTTAASAKGSAAAQALSVANRTTAPAGVTFSAPTTKGAGISLGSIGPGQVKAFWVRVTTANSAAQNADGGTWRVEGDTAA